MSTMQTFPTGATRSSDADKIDPEGFLSPLVLRRYSEYLQKHRVQADGQLRDSDNWQKGMPLAKYFKSAWRHFLDAWTIHRGWASEINGYTLEDSLCAVLFNIMGYLHEVLKTPGTQPPAPLSLTLDQALDLDKPKHTYSPTALEKLRALLTRGVTAGGDTSGSTV